MGRVIDGGCFAGDDPATGTRYPSEAVLADFDRHGIAGGLVGSSRDAR